MGKCDEDLSDLSFCVPRRSFLVAALLLSLHAIVIFVTYGRQTASELRGQRCLSLKHQSVRIARQPQLCAVPLGASHALLDWFKLIQL